MGRLSREAADGAAVEYRRHGGRNSRNVGDRKMCMVREGVRIGLKRWSQVSRGGNREVCFPLIFIYFVSPASCGGADPADNRDRCLGA